MTVPKLNVRGVEPGEDTAAYLRGITDDRLNQAFLDFYYSTLTIPPHDSELVELVRIRNAIAQSCQYCLSVRDIVPNLGKEAEGTVLRFEQKDLPDRQKAALRLVEAFLAAPSKLTDAAKADALEHFSPEEIVGLILKLASFLVNKPRAGLGIDRPLDPDRLTPGYHVSPRPT